MLTSVLHARLAMFAWVEQLLDTLLSDQKKEVTSAQQAIIALREHLRKLLSNVQLEPSEILQEPRLKLTVYHVQQEVQQLILVSMIMVNLKEVQPNVYHAVQEQLIMLQDLNACVLESLELGNPLPMGVSAMQDSQSQLKLKAHKLPLSI